MSSEDTLVCELLCEALARLSRTMRGPAGDDARSLLAYAPAHIQSEVQLLAKPNAIARINFATTVEKAGHPSLALTHFEQVIDAVDVDAQARATARHRYGVLQISEAMVMCTAKDRSAERDSPQCASEKQAQLEKGAHYLQSLLDDARMQRSLFGFFGSLQFERPNA